MRTVQLLKKMSDASKQKPGPKRKLSDSVRKRNRRELNAKNNTKTNIFRRVSATIDGRNLIFGNKLSETMATTVRVG